MRLQWFVLLLVALTACHSQPSPAPQPSIVFVTPTPDGPVASSMDQLAAEAGLQSASFPASGSFDLDSLRFSNQTTATNVNITHATALGRMDDGSMMMVGAAAGDFDNDGWVDLFAIGGGLQSDALFINQGDDTFQDMAASAGLTELHVGSGAAVGDYNGDGWLDIYVTSFGPLGFMRPGENRLYRNNGDLTFTDVAAEAGVNLTSPEMEDGMGASFGDYDLDGDLDLFVTGWRKESHGNRLFRNNGDGIFSDVTDAAGIVDDGVRGFSPCFADMDGDHFPELLLVADFGTSRYFVNNADGTFMLHTQQSQVGQEWSGMGSTVGDFNNDGRLDWYATAIYDDDQSGRGDGNKLYYNQGNQNFTENAQAAGVDDGGWGWGALAVDLNHDGWLDLVETNGWEDLKPYKDELSKLWLSNGNGTFSEVAQAVGFEHVLDGRGLLSFDYDNDGDQDIVVTAVDEALQLYRNDLTGATMNWLRVWLDTRADPGLASNGIGSRVSVRVGGQTYYRHILACPHYLTQSELSAHFGLGAAPVVDELRVEWADGTVTTLNNVAINQTMTVAAEAR